MIGTFIMFLAGFILGLTGKKLDKILKLGALVGFGLGSIYAFFIFLGSIVVDQIGFGIAVGIMGLIFSVIIYTIITILGGLFGWFLKRIVR